MCARTAAHQGHGHGAIRRSTINRALLLQTRGARTASVAKVRRASGRSIALGAKGTGAAVDSCASALSGFARAHPLAFGALFTACKTSAADGLVQFLVEGKSLAEWDKKRTLVFTTFGFGFMGIGQYFLIGRLPAAVFPKAGEYAAKSLVAKLSDLIGTRNLALQVAWDQLVVMPTLFLPVYYSVSTFALDPQPTAARTIEVALEKWRANLWDDLLSSWQIWVPANVLNFAFCPLHLRIPCMATFSMAYSVVLSATRGGADGDGGQQGVGGAAE